MNVMQYLDPDAFRALRLTHPAIYLLSLQPLAWNNKVGQRLWLKEMIRKMVIRPLGDTSLESAMSGLSQIGVFIMEGRRLASQMVVKRNIAPCVGNLVADRISSATSSIEINSTWRCEDLDWHPILDWKLVSSTGHKINIVCSKYYAFVEAYENVHICVSKREMHIDLFVDGDLTMDWEMDMNELPFSILNAPEPGRLASIVEESLGVTGVNPLALAGMLWLLLREGGLACCCCEPCLARFDEMRDLFQGVRMQSGSMKPYCSIEEGKSLLVRKKSCCGQRAQCEEEIKKLVLGWVRQGEEVFSEFRRIHSKGLDISGIQRTLKSVKRLGASTCMIGPFQIMLRYKCPQV